MVLNAWMRELFGVKKSLDKKIDEGMLWWFANVERDRDRFGCQARKENGGGFVRGNA